ncbi:hypothetical protein AOQ84DRAFT_152074 [Glonium stellatum]|uniref:Zn(2)-C6 fungal-type domain-containing protein n=1 Tax=Glonium stellatum TaxID=574774 RepID=A0A8E2ERL1_9PEZI|nr:hypothetical protein AOQ84DRAFT_152074 [Glonium stellatum]
MRQKGSTCRHCQARHLKCVRDADSEKCRRCNQSGIDCEQNSALRVRNVVSITQRNPQGRRTHRRLDYAEDQVWVPVPPRLNFAPPDQQEATTPQDSSETTYSPQPQQSQLQETLISPSVASSTLSIHDEHQSPDIFSVPGTFAPLSQFPPGTQGESAPLYQSVSSWPFESGREAQLFLHFVQRLSGWLDALDSNRHFAMDVPRRAAYVPVIMNAILASASRHVAFVSKIEDTESAKYHNKCLENLIPILDNPLDILDENLFAAIIILRQYEELDEADERCHLFGSTRMVNSITHSATCTSLREAANWVALRQEIYVSLTNRQPVSIVLDAYRDSSYFHSDTEDAWANRIVFLFAKILNYAFKPVGVAPEESWSQLEEQVEAWNMTKPQYFSPLWVEHQPGERNYRFPDIMMLGASQVNGMQHYCLAKILLATYDPRLLKLGFDTRRLRKESEEIVLQNLRMIIGLAMSNPHIESSFMHASHILSACGTYFCDKHEQDRAIEFLENMEQRAIWRTSSIVMRLQEQWRQ